MSHPCIFHHDVPHSAPHCPESTDPKNFLLGLAISALMWASLAIGTILTVS